jgi:two-component system, response regulator PdtaR
MTLSKLRVLVVEDEALVAMDIEAMIEVAGHVAVGLADDHDSAVELADETGPDLALVDVQLAQGDSGIDVARSLLARGVPVIFATGNCPADRGVGLALGCLDKPYSYEAMAATLDIALALLDARQPPSPPSALHLY